MIRFLIALALVLSWHVSAQTNTVASTNAFAKSPVNIPDAENAVVAFEKAAAKLKIDSDDYDKLLRGLMGIRGNQPLPPSTSNLLAKVVAENAHVIPEFRKAAALTHSHYPEDWSKGWYVPLPYLPKIKAGVNFFDWVSLRHAVQGKEKEAVEACLMQLALARSLESERPLISHAVRITCLREVVGSLEALLNRIAVGTNSLAKLRKELEQLERQETTGELFARALHFEDEVMLPIFVDKVSIKDEAEFLMQFAGWDSTKRTNDAPLLREALIQTIETDRKHLHETYNEVRRLWSAPYPARLQAVQQASVKMQSWTNSPRGVVGLFDLESALAAEAKGVVHLRLARIAIALEEYRCDHHRLYPPFLSHLVPKYLDQVPHDPMDGKPMRYQKIGRGYKAWSVGGPTYNRWGPERTNYTFSVISGP